MRTFSEHFVNLSVDLSKHIEVLLRHHNCVIVPAFGGFIADYRSAVIDRDNNRILPPAKNVLFNAKLTNNDGLLANTIAVKEELSYPKALEFISNRVNFWKDALQNGERVEVGEVGFLYRQGDQIVFEQSRELNLLLQAYGLPNLQFIGFEQQKEVAPAKELPVDKEIKRAVPKTEQVKEAVAESPKEIPVLTGQPAVAEKKEETPVVAIEHSRRKGRWKYLAAVAAIPLMFYSYWIPVKTDFLDTGKIQIADFNPIKSNPVRNYQTRLASSFEPFQKQTSETWEDLTSQISDHVEVYNYALDEELYIPIRLDRKPIEEVEAETGHFEDKNLPYHVIGGCFSVESNAHQLVADLKKQGYPAHVLDKKNGLYRVSSGDYASRNEATSAMRDFKSAGFSGWVLKK